MRRHTIGISKEEPNVNRFGSVDEARSIYVLGVALHTFKLGLALSYLESGHLTAGTYLTLAGILGNGFCMKRGMERQW